MQLPKNAMKAKIAAGRPVFGTWLQAASPINAEIVACSGLDFAIIDQEHGIGGLETTVAMMRAFLGSDTTPMIRVPGGDVDYLKRIVDAGAQALLIPMVNTAAQAKAIVDATLYPPRGQRGNAAGIVRGSRYGFVSDYVARAHEEMLIVPQVETVEAVGNAAAIAAVPGVDMVFIGPSDLSGSAGVPGQTGAPEVEKLFAEAIAGIRSAGKPFATVPRDGKSWQDLFAEGYMMVSHGSDIATVKTAAMAQVEAWTMYPKPRS